MNQTPKLAAALLVVTAALQVWSLNRQSDLQQQIRNLASEHNMAMNRMQHELNAMQSSLERKAEAEQWVAVQKQAVEPSATCDAAQGRVEWELRQWAPGTGSKLLYRSGPNEAWQEATVQPKGGQNFAAVFPVPAKPLLEVGLDVQYPAGKNSATARVEQARSNKAAYDRDYQYQIVAEGPQFNRSTGARGLALGGQFVVQAKIRARVERDNRYEVELYSHREGASPCVTVQSAEVRAYAGDRMVTTLPLADRDPSQLVAQWQSQEALTRLEVVVRYGSGEEVVEISL